MKANIGSRLAGAATLVLATTLAQQAAAQTAPAERAPVQEAASDEGLGEIIVTAQRTTQNLQNVPIAATVLTGEQLTERGVTNVVDLQQVTPGVSITNIGRSTSINIRGVGLSQTSPTSSPGIAYYMNGVLIPHENSLLGSFYDLAAVEVLRGPQGTLAGQNSTGGAIYFTTPAPRFDEVSGYLDQTVGDYSWLRTVGAVNLPLADWAALRVAGVYEVRDSYTRNTGSRSQPGNTSFHGIRADLAIRPTERLQMNLRFEGSWSDNDNFAYVPFTSARGTNAFTIAEDAISRNKQDGLRFDGTLRYDLTDDVQFRYVGSYAYNTNADIGDADRSTVLPGLGLGGANSRYNIWTHEVNLLSTGDGPVQWIIGAFHLYDRINTQLIGYAGSPSVPTTPLTTNIITTTLGKSDSVFGQLTFRLDPRWSVVVGGRYSWDYQSQNRVTPPFLGFSEARSQEPTGRAALNFQITPDTLLYASIAKGYKAGGNNLLAADPAYEPETNLVEEIGLKTTFLDRRLRVNASVFNSEYDKIQVQSGQVVPPIPVQLPITQNTGKAHSWGGEVELTGAFDALRFNVSLAYLNSKTTQTISLINVNTGAVETVPEGQTLPFAPKWTISGGIEHEFVLGAGTLTPRVQVAYVSEQYATLFPSRLTLMDDRAIVDLRLNYQPNETWQIELFANNLLDRTYVTGINQGGTNTLGGFVYGAPRQIGGRVRLSF